MDGGSTADRGGIQVISRAAAVLRALAAQPGGMSLGQIARAVALPRSTVQRIVAALAGEGLVAAGEGHGSFALGPGLEALAGRRDGATRDRLRPFLREIAARTGETADLARLEGEEMLFVDQIEGSHRLRTVSRIGERFPLTTTANGKAALACLPEAEAARLALAEIQRGGARVPGLTDLLTDLREIRGGALALDREAHTDGICALGFAVRDTRGAVYAVSVPVPASRFARVRGRLEEVLRGARRGIGKALAEG